MRNIFYLAGYNYFELVSKKALLYQKILFIGLKHYI